MEKFFLQTTSSIPDFYSKSASRGGTKLFLRNKLKTIFIHRLWRVLCFGGNDLKVFIFTFAEGMVYILQALGIDIFTHIPQSIL